MALSDNPLGFTSEELFTSAFEHEKAARNGMAAGPNIAYVRTFQRCAWAMRIVAEQLKAEGL